MIEWEYKTVSRDMMVTELQTLGHEGWELVTVVVWPNAAIRYFFKRPFKHGL